MRKPLKCFQMMEQGEPEHLEDNSSVDGYREMSLSYAELETKLGEIDRARAIYSHGSQMSDPRVSHHIADLIFTGFYFCI